MPKTEPPSELPPASPPPKWLKYFLIAMGVVFLYLSFFSDEIQKTRTQTFEISYTHFKRLVKDQRVHKVLLKGDIAKGELYVKEPIGPNNAKSKHFTTRLPSLDDPNLLAELEAKGVQIKVGREAKDNVFSSIMTTLLPWLLFLLIIIWFIRQSSRNVGGGLGGSKELKRLLDATPGKTVEVPDVTFKDVAGQENAKREVAELVDYLRHPLKYRSIGAEIPRGVLLMGPPGTGKRPAYCLPPGAESYNLSLRSGSLATPPVTFRKGLARGLDR